MVDSVAVDSWAVDFGLLDADDRLVAERRALPRRAPRRGGRAVFARVPARELYERTGIQLLPINTIFELGGAWRPSDDPALERARTLLLIPDLLHFWLCGSARAEFTNATTTQCYDPRAGDWAADLLDRLDIPGGSFPRSSRPAHGSAPSRREVAERHGARRADVVAVATHDTGSAVAAVPFRRAGSAYISVGTWSLVGRRGGASR